MAAHQISSRLDGWLARFADRLLGPIARASRLLLDDDALLVHTPRALEDMGHERR